MKKFYQHDWHKIEFSEFYKLSSSHIASADFYQLFYKELFKYYRDWTQLSSTWRQEKEQCADFIISRSGKGSILSVGCGLGYMEHYLQSHLKETDLYIHEVAPSAWQWIEPYFPKDRKLLGFLPECLPAEIRFDFIYLSAVDYALDDHALCALLSSIRPFISKNGKGAQCLLISASFQDTSKPKSYKEIVRSMLRKGKEQASTILDCLGMHSRGQLWGWIRTREEYHSLMQRAGYTHIEDGFIDPEKRDHYWISGR